MRKQIKNYKGREIALGSVYKIDYDSFFEAMEQVKGIHYKCGAQSHIARVKLPDGSEEEIEVKNIPKNLL